MGFGGQHHASQSCSGSDHDRCRWPDRNYAGATAAPGQGLSRPRRRRDVGLRAARYDRSRVEHLANSGRQVRVLPQTKIEDGINAARLILPRAWFDRVKCADGLEALRQYRAEFDERTRTFRDRPRHDWAPHFADGFKVSAIGYRAMTLAEPESDPIADLLRPRTFNDLMAELETRDDD
jgi:hypothetical protein